MNYYAEDDIQQNVENDLNIKYNCLRSTRDYLDAQTWSAF